LLDQIVVEQLGYQDRLQIFSPHDEDYFAELSSGHAALAFSGFIVGSLLQNARLEVRPVESRPGAANEIFDRYWRRFIRLLEEAPARELSTAGMMAQVATGRLFGLGPLLDEAAAAFASVRRGDVELPTVLLVGEIYARLDPFANDGVIEKLEARGLRVRLSPVSEWLEYCDLLAGSKPGGRGLAGWISHALQRRIQDSAYARVARVLHWPARLTAAEAVAAASEYLRGDLEGEAVMTLGAALAEWRHGNIQGTVSVGPLECMPNKIAEAQFFHARQKEGLRSLTLSLNGEPLDTASLDTFAFEIRESWQGRLADKDPKTESPKSEIRP
jgi:predicted nucleotide-binding protein (sugar kinase/HSP70/actin superfamily)